MGEGGGVPDPNSNFLNSHGKVAEHRPPTPRHPPPPWKFFWICSWIYDLEFTRFIEAHNYFKHIKNSSVKSLLNIWITKHWCLHVQPCCIIWIVCTCSVLSNTDILTIYRMQSSTSIYLFYFFTNVTNSSYGTIFNFSIFFYMEFKVKIYIVNDSRIRGLMNLFPKLYDFKGFM